MSKYDIIIIGSGLGGLECGAILSKEGYHVCVLEKNELFGGCFQTYQRGGHRMDTGIHYIGSLDEGQIMNQYFRYFGIMDKLSIKRMDEEVFDRIYYKDAIYDYAMGHERFMETLCHSFPHERENLKRYVAAIRSVGDLISTDHPKKYLPSASCRIRTFSGVISPKIRTASPGPGNGWRVIRCYGIPSSRPTWRTSSLNSRRRGSHSFKFIFSGSPPTL